MPNLFLVDGASGTGKSDLIAYLYNEHAARAGRFLTVLKKYSTRKPRALDLEIQPRDLELVDVDTFARHEAKRGFYAYEYGDAKYGLSAKWIDRAVERYQNTFLIVRSRQIIRALITDYSSIRVIPILIYSDQANIRSRFESERTRLIQAGREEQDLEEEYRNRQLRSELVWQDYVWDPMIYQEVVINRSSKADYLRIIEAILFKYNQPLSSGTVSVAPGG